MKSSHKRLLPFVAIACIGLAGLSVTEFAQAQAPGKRSGPIAVNGPVKLPPFKCLPGELAFKVGRGTDDNFALTGTADPKPNPSAALITAQGLVAATNIYDQTANDYKFGDTFPLNPPGQITKLRVTTRLKANAGQPDNDGISFSTKPGFTPGHFSFGLSTLAPPWNQGQVKLFEFEFNTPASTVLVNAPGSPLSLPTALGGANFYNDLNLNHVLHIYVQDDTSVDFIAIEGCYKPAPPKYDLVASKVRDANLYILRVTNAGSPISPTGKIDVMEIVPAGLTILGASGTSWTCPGVIFPVIGPDAFTCTYPINAVIPTGPLPPIVLKTEGTAECPNCMKVKLYLRAFEGGRTPVKEDDMKNNASCAK